MRDKFTGTGVALVTPFTAELAVDYTALTTLVNDCIEKGVEYLVALGTTAETATLSADEKEKVLNTILEANNGRVPVMLGIGGNNTQVVVDQIHNQNFTGIDAILSVCPYYNKPSQRGVKAHFDAVAEASPVPVVLYNIPGRTGLNMELDTVLQLAQDHANIIGIKEASGDLIQIMETIAAVDSDFLVISGDDALTLPIISLGGHGVISATANALPEGYSQLVRDCLAGDFAKAKQFQYKALPLLNMFFEEGNPAGVKATLELQGRATGHVRLPLVPVSDGLMDRMKAFLSSF